MANQSVTQKIPDVSPSQDSGKLTVLAEDAQKRADEVTALMGEFHKHKLAAEAHKLALSSEVKILRKQHKELRKQAAGYLKKQKKDELIGLSGFAKQLTGKLFSRKQDNDDNTEIFDDPPRYEEGTEPSAPEEVEINVAQSDVEKANEKAQKLADMAEAAEKQAMQL